MCVGVRTDFINRRVRGCDEGCRRVSRADTGASRRGLRQRLGDLVRRILNTIPPISRSVLNVEQCQ
jgi:hypothetical protein